MYKKKKLAKKKQRKNVLRLKAKRRAVRKSSSSK